MYQQQVYMLLGMKPKVSFFLDKFYQLIHILDWLLNNTFYSVTEYIFKKINEHSYKKKSVSISVGSELPFSGRTFISKIFKLTYLAHLVQIISLYIYM